MKVTVKIASCKECPHFLYDTGYPTRHKCKLMTIELDEYDYSKCIHNKCPLKNKPSSDYRLSPAYQREDGTFIPEGYHEMGQ
jgi:hypothetical protein